MVMDGEAKRVLLLFRVYHCARCPSARLPVSFCLLKDGVLHCHTPVLPQHKLRQTFDEPSAAQWLRLRCTNTTSSSDRLLVAQTLSTLASCATACSEKRRHEPLPQFVTLSKLIQVCFDKLNLNAMWVIPGRHAMLFSARTELRCKHPGGYKSIV